MVIAVRLLLPHLCRMYFPILINWISIFPLQGMLDGIFHFNTISNRIFCKQTVKNLIRRHVCLFVCFVALRPKSTAMVIAGRSVHLTTLFPGQA